MFLCLHTCPRALPAQSHLNPVPGFTRPSGSHAISCAQGAPPNTASLHSGRRALRDHPAASSPVSSVSNAQSQAITIAQPQLENTDKPVTVPCRPWTLAVDPTVDCPPTPTLPGSARTFPGSPATPEETPSPGQPPAHSDRDWGPAPHPHRGGRPPRRSTPRSAQHTHRTAGVRKDRPLLCRAHVLGRLGVQEQADGVHPLGPQVRLAAAPRSVCRVRTRTRLGGRLGG